MDVHDRASTNTDLQSNHTGAREEMTLEELRKLHNKQKSRLNRQFDLELKLLRERYDREIKNEYERQQTQRKRVSPLSFGGVYWAETAYTSEYIRLFNAYFRSARHSSPAAPAITAARSPIVANVQLLQSLSRALAAAPEGLVPPTTATAMEENGELLAMLIATLEKLEDDTMATPQTLKEQLRGPVSKCCRAMRRLLSVFEPLFQPLIEMVDVRLARALLVDLYAMNGELFSAKELLRPDAAQDAGSEPTESGSSVRSSARHERTLSSAKETPQSQYQIAEQAIAASSELIALLKAVITQSDADGHTHSSRLEEMNQLIGTAETNMAALVGSLKLANRLGEHRVRRKQFYQDANTFATSILRMNVVARLMLSERGQYSKAIVVQWQKVTKIIKELALALSTSHAASVQMLKELEIGRTLPAEDSPMPSPVRAFGDSLMSMSSSDLLLKRSSGYLPKASVVSTLGVSIKCKVRVGSV